MTFDATDPVHSDAHASTHCFRDAGQNLSSGFRGADGLREAPPRKEAAPM